MIPLLKNNSSAEADKIDVRTPALTAVTPTQSAESHMGLTLLSNKLKLELDKIPIDSLEDFQKAQESLKIYLKKFPLPQKYLKYKEAIKSIEKHINDFFQSSENNAEYESKADEYNQIIRDLIQAKINEIQSLNETEKNAYLDAQQTKKALVQSPSHSTKNQSSRQEQPRPSQISFFDIPIALPIAITERNGCTLFCEKKLNSYAHSTPYSDNNKKWFNPFL